MTPTLSVAPELFKLVSENTYTLQNNFLAKQALQSFALGNDLFRLATTYGLNLDVTIENNNLLGFSFNYNVESLYSKLSFTFSDVGTTTIPVDVNGSGSGEDPDPNPSLIPTEWIGTYTGTSSSGDFNGETNITVVITESSITINGTSATVTSYDEYEGLTLDINGTEYYLTNMDYDGGVKLALMSSDYSFIATGLVK